MVSWGPQPCRAVSSRLFSLGPCQPAPRGVKGSHLRCAVNDGILLHLLHHTACSFLLPDAGPREPRDAPAAARPHRATREMVVSLAQSPQLLSPFSNPGSRIPVVWPGTVSREWGVQSHSQDPGLGHSSGSRGTREWMMLGELPQPPKHWPLGMWQAVLWHQRAGN